MAVLWCVSFVTLHAQVGFTQSVTFDGSNFKGDKNAKVTLIEFASQGCHKHLLGNFILYF